MVFTALLLAIAAYLAPLLLVSGMPSFDGVTSWSTMNTLVPGMSQLQGLGPAAAAGEVNSVPFYMYIAAPRGTHLELNPAPARSRTHHAHTRQSQH